jgi:hypothetical protein
MKIFSLLFTAMSKAASQRTLTAILYAANFACAAILALTFRSVASSDFANAPVIENLMGQFQFSIYADIMRFYGKEINAVLSAGVWLAAGYFFFNIFLAGGAVAMLSGIGGDFSTGNFFGACGDYFFRFVRIVLFWGGAAIVILGALLALISTVIGLATKHAVSEIPVIAAMGIGALIFVLVALMLLAIADYARIVTVSNNEPSAFRALRVSFLFVARNPFKIASAQILLALPSAAVYLLYLLFEDRIDMTSVLTVILLFCIQQCVVASRIWLHLWSYASQISIYEELNVPSNDFLRFETSPGISESRA